MLKGRVPQKKARSKKQSKEEPIQGKEQSQEVGRMHMRMVELESKLKQAYNLNDLYLTQITHLEQDNLTLCVRLQELKVIHEGKLREYIQENDQLREQNNQLLKVVSFLEQQMGDMQTEADDLRVRMGEFREEAELGKTAQLRVSHLEIDVERAKISLLESERYWITRCQTLLEEQKAGHERVLMEKDSEFSLKMKGMGGELAQKEKESDQKTREIYKLIQYIHGLAG